MLSSRVPPDTVVATKVNMFWDGMFEAAVWLMTLAGLAGLWRAGQRPDVPWSGRTFIGSLLAGWGMFKVVEGLIDHQWLGLHHVHESSENLWTGDGLFLLMGLVLMGGGAALIRPGRREPDGRGTGADPGPG